MKKSTWTVIIILSIVGAGLVGIGGLAGIGWLSYYASLPMVPVELTYRESLIGEGYVAQFKNLSDKHLKILVRIENSTVNQVHEQILSLSPNTSTELGWAEGWKFTSGDSVVAKLDGYKSQAWVIP